MTIVPLGDQALLVYLPDETAAARFAAAVQAANPAWLHDLVPAYASVGIFFDANIIRPLEVQDWLAALPVSVHSESVTRSAAIPVCYEFQLDTSRVCEQTGLTPADVIRLHTSAVYTVYAIGFVPGFPYLGYLPEQLCGVPRLQTPRVRVEPGSVGLTGRQTGIYPLARPGGWNLIGRTPITIVDLADDYFPLRVGDQIRFERIDDLEFSRLEGERLFVTSEHDNV
jgi:inhibitor of KinA